MKKVMIGWMAALLPLATTAQQKIPLKPEQWQFKEGTVQFETYQSRPALHLLTNKDVAVPKGLVFESGTIEFDLAPEDEFFAGTYFRRQDSLETECFYLRVNAGTIPGAMQSVQYAPFIKGINLWDLLPYSQGNATFKAKEWNHIKLVIAGRKMMAYVNDMNRPALYISHLEGNTTKGSLGFGGKGYIASLTVKPAQASFEQDEPDPTYNDPRYLRQWQVSEAISLPAQQEPYYRVLPDLKATWEPLTAERLGLVNITRLYGGGRNDRKMVWLRTKLRADVAQERLVALGFSDEIWVYVNKRPVYIDKNIYGSPAAKSPRGRCSIENTSFRLPLQQGDNEIVIALANNFDGWGLIARLDQMEGLQIVE